MSLEAALERRLEVINCTPAGTLAAVGRPAAARRCVLCRLQPRRKACLHKCKAQARRSRQLHKTALLASRLQTSKPSCVRTRPTPASRRCAPAPAPPPLLLGCAPLRGQTLCRSTCSLSNDRPPRRLPRLQGAKALVAQLQARGVAVYLIRRAAEPGATAPAGHRLTLLPPAACCRADQLQCGSVPPAALNRLAPLPPQRRLPRAVPADCAGAGRAAQEPVCQPHELAGAPPMQLSAACSVCLCACGLVGLRRLQLAAPDAPLGPESRAPRCLPARATARWTTTRWCPPSSWALTSGSPRATRPVAPAACCSFALPPPLLLAVA